MKGLSSPLYRTLHLFFAFFRKSLATFVVMLLRGISFCLQTITSKLSSRERSFVIFISIFILFFLRTKHRSEQNHERETNIQSVPVKDVCVYIDVHLNIYARVYVYTGH